MRNRHQPGKDLRHASHSVSHLHVDSGIPGGRVQRKSLGNLQCPIARSLERVGEWWSILILREELAR